MIRGVSGTAQYLDLIRRALDELEGYPSQGVYVDGRIPPPVTGITHTVGRVLR